MLLFDTIKLLMKDAVADPDFIRKNTILQDGSTKTELLSRIDALQRAYPITKTFADVSAVEGGVSVNNLLRQIEIAASITGSCTFNFSTHPPLKLFGWLLSSDSTVLVSEIEIHYRFSSSDPYKKLLQIDHVDNVTGIQLKLNIPSGTISPRVLKSLVILAEQI